MGNRDDFFYGLLATAAIVVIICLWILIFWPRLEVNQIVGLVLTWATCILTIKALGSVLR